MASSQDSSSDSSTSSPKHPYDGPNIEAENVLPGVLMSQEAVYAQFFYQLMNLGSALPFPLLRDAGHALLQLIPCDVVTCDKLKVLFMEQGEKTVSMESLFFSSNAAEVILILKCDLIFQVISVEFFIFFCF